MPYFVLQFAQIVRTRRCASTASAVLATRNGSTPMSVSRVKALAASFVWSVLNTRCPVSDACQAVPGGSPRRRWPLRPTPGSRRLRGDRGGFNVADFADEHDVRVVAEDRAEAGGEGEPDLRVDLNLLD